MPHNRAAQSISEEIGCLPAETRAASDDIDRFNNSLLPGLSLITTLHDNEEVAAAVRRGLSTEVKLYSDVFISSNQLINIQQSTLAHAR